MPSYADGRRGKDVWLLGEDGLLLQFESSTVAEGLALNQAIVQAVDEVKLPRSLGDLATILRFFDQPSKGHYNHC